MEVAIGIAVVALVCILATWCLISIIECFEDRGSLRRAAISRGYAEWGVNPTNGKPEFQWKKLQ